MPLFLLARRFITRFTRRRIAALLIFAASIILIGAVLFSLTQHISFGTSVYWAITTATTVGYGDIDPHNTIGRIIANVVMLTTIPTIGAVFAVWTGSAVIQHFRRLFGMDKTLPRGAYTVAYGSHSVITRVANELSRNGEPVVLVTRERPIGLDQDVHFIAGDPTDEAVISKSDLGRANRALIACDNDADTLVIAVAIHSGAPDLETYALTQSPRVARALTELGVTHTLAADELVAHTLAKSLETPQAGDVLLALVNTENFRFVQVPVSSEHITKRLSAVRADGTRQLVLGLSRDGTVDIGLGDDPTLTDGDSLIILEPCGPS